MTEIIRLLQVEISECIYRLSLFCVCDHHWRRGTEVSDSYLIVQRYTPSLVESSHVITLTQLSLVNISI